MLCQENIEFVGSMATSFTYSRLVNSYAGVDYYL